MKAYQSHEKNETKNIRLLVFSFSSINLGFWCFLFCFFMWFARFQILICEPLSIWRKFLVLSWLYRNGNCKLSREIQLQLSKRHWPHCNALWDTLKRRNMSCRYFFFFFFLSSSLFIWSGSIPCHCMGSFRYYCVWSWTDLGTIHILRQHNVGLFLTHPPPLCQHKYSTGQQNWPFSRPTHQVLYWRNNGWFTEY